jgi:hypothetical protein
MGPEGLERREQRTYLLRTQLLQSWVRQRGRERES